MKGAGIIFLSALALALSDGEVELNAFGCPVDPEVHKVLPHTNYCNLFYSCVGGNRVELRCPDELVFNAVDEVCDWPLNVDCGNKGIHEFVPDSEEDVEENNPTGNGDPSLVAKICGAENSDGVLVAHENCNQFYICERNIPVTMECPENLMFDYTVGVCNWPNKVECGSRIVPEQSGADTKPVAEGDSGKPLGVYEFCAKSDSDGILLPHKTCNRFYKCSDNRPVVFNCPSELVYNIKERMCDWQKNVACGERPIVEDEKEEDGNNEIDNDESAGTGGHGHADPSQAPAICAVKHSDGVLVAHENCNQFYKCWQGTPVALDCPLNLLYNAKLEYCDWPQNVDCGDRYKSSRK